MSVTVIWRIRWGLYLTVMFFPALLLISFAYAAGERESGRYMESDYLRRWKAVLTGVKQ